MIALSDLGRYVSVDVNAINSTSVADAAGDDEEDDGSGVRLYQSIYETALRNQIPRAVIDDMIRVYSYDVDFQRKVQPGDAFDVLYAGEDETPRRRQPQRSDVCGADRRRRSRRNSTGSRRPTTTSSTITTRPERARRNSWSASRCPTASCAPPSACANIRSWATPRCIPAWTGRRPTARQIFAAGNGVVDKVGWEGGYGKYVRVKHNNGYETAYGHMTAYANGIEPGVKVRQGQVLGFVGSTGLSTGAHLHYEIMVNGRFVDPMRIRLPRGRVLENQLLTAFETERDRLDGMMARSNPRVAQNAAR